MSLEKHRTADRYLASDRFHVPEGEMTTFENKWTERKSSFETIPGIRFFSLLKRTSLFGVKYDSDIGNYLSFIYWDSKLDYDAWRNSNIFTNAYGEEGPPQSVFYDGLLFKACNDSAILHTKFNSHNAIEYDSNSKLVKPNVFIAQNRFTVIDGQELAFEAHWATRPSYLDQVPGFLAFSLLRREGVAEDGFNYISSTIWESQDAFVSWSNSDNFKAAHANAHHSSAANRPPMYQQSPKLAFYEGKLSLCSTRGV